MKYCIKYKQFHLIVTRPPQKRINYRRTPCRSGWIMVLEIWIFLFWGHLLDDGVQWSPTKSSTPNKFIISYTYLTYILFPTINKAKPIPHFSFTILHFLFTNQLHPSYIFNWVFLSKPSFQYCLSLSSSCSSLKLYLPRLLCFIASQK